MIFMSCRDHEKRLHDMEVQVATLMRIVEQNLGLSGEILKNIQTPPEPVFSPESYFR